MASAINQVMAAMLGASRGSAESLLFDSINSTGQGAWAFGDTANTYHGGQQSFTMTGAHTITKIVMPLLSVGTITGKTFTVSIWADSSHNLGSLIAASNGVTGASWSHTNVTFTFASPVSLSASTNYHITVEPTSAFDGTNYAKGYFTTPTIIAGHLDAWSNAGVSQYPLSFTDYDWQMQIWGT